MGWKQDEKGRIYKEVEIDAERGTKEFSEKVFAEMERAASELEEVEIGEDDGIDG